MVPETCQEGRNRCGQHQGLETNPVRILFCNLHPIYQAISSLAIEEICGTSLVLQNPPADAGDMGSIPALGGFHMLQGN